jgi:hypothetical protein
VVNQHKHNATVSPDVEGFADPTNGIKETTITSHPTTETNPIERGLEGVTDSGGSNVKHWATWTAKTPAPLINSDLM